MEGSLVAYKVFTNGSVLQASEVNDNLMKQSIAVFSNTAARTAAITSPVQGQTTYIEADDLFEFWNGSSWVGINRNLQSRNRFFAVVNNFTNQTTYADFPNAADKTSLDMTFIKKRTSSSLLVVIAGSWEHASGAIQRQWLGLNVAGTDYDITNVIASSGTSYETVSGSRLLTGISAGSLAIKPRFRTATASSDNFREDQCFNYSVEEIY
jgi:hypothetical protein